MKNWNEEPNREVFMAHGLTCVVNRVEHSKHLCGYVGVRRGHPLFGKGYDDHVTVDPEEFSKRVNIDRYGVFNIFTAGAHNNDETMKQNLLSLSLVLECHGGLTFANKLHFLDNDDLWFFGFDAAHSGDVSPGYPWTQGGVYRDFEYMKNETINLARQIAERFPYESKEQD